MTGADAGSHSATDSTREKNGFKAPQTMTLLAFLRDDTTATLLDQAANMYGNVKQFEMPDLLGPEIVTVILQDVLKPVIFTKPHAHRTWHPLARDNENILFKQCFDATADTNHEHLKERAKRQGDHIIGWEREEVNIPTEIVGTADAGESETT
eukprot:g48148.t1